MNTTAAAIQANVTVPTVRAWCRNGVVDAIKQAGRWIINAASLATRIAIGELKESRMTEQPKYAIDEGTVVRYGSEYPAWTIVRTDGTQAGYGNGKDNRIHDAVFFTREMAETFAKFYENTPPGYRLESASYPARSMRSGRRYWLITGGSQEDPASMRHTWDEDTKVADTWPEGTTWLDVLISLVNRHAEGAPARIQRKAEQDAVAAAETAVREAREAQLSAARAKKGELATVRQVDYILQLLAVRERTGEGGGFFYGPTDRAGIEELSKAEASTYITSLKGDY